MKIIKNDINYLSQLTSIQKRILSSGKQDSCVASIKIVFNCKIDINRLERAIELIIEECSLLKSNIQYKGTYKPVQVFLKSINRKILIDKTDMETYSINIDKNPWVFVKNEESKEVLFIYHTVIFDSISINTIITKFLNNYNEKFYHSEDNTFKLIEKYNKDYKKKYLNILESLKVKYSECEDIFIHNNFNVDYDQIEVGKWNSIEIVDGEELAVQIQCAWGIVLQVINYTKSSFFGIANYVKQRNDTALGNFFNFMPCIFSCEEDDLIEEILEEIKLNYSHTGIDYYDMSEYIKEKVSMETCVDISSEIWKKNIENKFQVNIYNDNPYSKFIQSGASLLLNINILDDRKAKYRLIWNNGTYSEEQINMFSNMFSRIFKQINEKKVSKIRDILLTELESERKNIYNFEEEDISYLTNKILKENENEIILYDGKQKINFFEFDTKVNQITNYLINNVYKSEEQPVIALLMERSIEMIITIYAIMKSGGIYLPIDPTYPLKRIQFMLKDSKSKLVITNTTCDKLNCNKIYYSDLISKAQRESKIAPIYADRSKPAYLLYTSGSTGNPKGVLVSHEAILNRLNWMKKYCKIDQNDTILFKTPYTFDVSLIEILLWSISGSKLCILPPEEHKNPEKIMEYIKKYNITIIHFVPSMLKAFTYYFSTKKHITLGNLRYIVTSGETLLENHLTALKETFTASINNVNILNLYGPTEAAVEVAYYKCNWNDTNPIPIGKAIDNVELYCVDRFNRILPAGIAGQLGICGIALADGYLNNGELTNEKFIQHKKLNKRMYLTGDKVYYQPDKNIIFLGRIDNQIKIRGLRVEIGEIKNTILRFENVIEAEVVLKNRGSDISYLVAFVVFKDGSKDVAKLKQFISNDLAEYMIPDNFIVLDNMPVNTNGKVDITKLNIMELENNKTGNMILKVTEQNLLKLWEEVLMHKIIDIQSDFFSSGGDSIKAIYLLSKINATFDYNWNISDIISNSTIKRQAEILDAQNCIIKIQNNSNVVSECNNEVDSYVVNSSQKRLYFLSTLNENIAYNIVGIYKIKKGILNIEKVENAFNKLLLRHSVLRTSYSVDGEKVIATIHKECAIKIKNIIFEQNSKSLSEKIDSLLKPFDLAKAPLIRISVIQDSKDQYLAIELSHIIADGMSLSILINEFKEIYDGKEDCLETEVPYYSILQDGKEHEEYWLKEVNKKTEEIPIREDYQRPEKFSFKGDSIYEHYNHQLVQELSRKNKTTPAVVMLTALAILIRRLTKHEEFLIGLVVSGRTDQDSQKIIGPMINTLPLYIKINLNSSYEEVLTYIHNKVFNGLIHQEYPIDELINKLGLERTLDRNPLFNIMFTYLADFNIPLQISDVELVNCSYKTKSAKVDLSMFVYENEQKMELEYCTDIFSNKTAQEMNERLQRILKFMCSNSINTPIGTWDLILPSEKDVYLNSKQIVLYKKRDTIQKQFCDIVKQNSDKIAILYNDERYTYSQLEDYSNNVALFLESKGVTSNSIVGIFLENIPESIVSILAILKLGAAYLPIDKNTPIERINFMLNDSGTRFLISDNFDKINVEYCICLNEIIDQKYVKSKTKVCRGSRTDLCYVIYTSGSTGKPKGCLLNQESVSDYLNWAVNYYFEDFDQEIVYFSLFTSLSVDMTVTSIFTPLISGNTLQIHSNKLESLFEVFNDKHTNIVKLTPSHLKMLSHFDFSNTNIKKIIVAGEKLTKSVCEKIKIPSVRIFNEYGPTEATVGCMIYEYDPLSNMEVIPIGRAIEHMQIYILDSNNKLCLKGVEGEIFIGGSGVAKGYTDKSLTEQKFIINPLTNNKHDVVYATGDYAFYDDNGQIVYVGRRDNQKKLRGNRIELPEIEACLLRHREVENVYIYIDDNELFACIIACNDNIEIKNIIMHAKKWLPIHMVPDKFVILDSFPLLISGKIDEKKLKIIVSEQEEKSFGEEFTNECGIESRLKQIWMSVLKHDNFTIKDNFFEVGGNSLLLMNMHSEILKLDKNIQMVDYFKYTTIEEMASYISERNYKIDEDINVFSSKYMIGKEYTENRATFEYLLTQVTTQNIRNITEEYNLTPIMLIGAIIIVILSDMAESNKVQLKIQEKQYNHNIIIPKNKNIEEIIDLLKEKVDKNFEENIFSKFNIILTDTIKEMDEYQISIFYSKSNTVFFSFDSGYVDNIFVEDLCETLDKILNML